jgi:hypothetical protein
MNDFIPVLVVAVLGLIALIFIFSGGFGFGGIGRISESSRTVTLGADFTVSYDVGEKDILAWGGEVNSGLFSNLEEREEFDIENVGDVSEGTIKMKIWNSNYYGNLLMYVNGEEVFNGAPLIGGKTVNFDASVLKSNNVLEVKAENSGWKMWAPTVYILDVDLSVSLESKKTQSFEFELSGLEVESLNRARLLIFGTRNGAGNLDVLLNGNDIFEGKTPIYTDFAIDNFKAGTNTIELSADPNTEYNITSAQVVLFFG